jgi:hypothetical protein
LKGGDDSIAACGVDADGTIDECFLGLDAGRKQG